MVLLGPEYHYHTRLRDGRVHATRDSADYALLLLEEGSDASLNRARKVLGRVLGLQVVQPQSPWYGIWGYYLEEPADRMAPADWNWADFIGGTLLVIELRHGARLGAELRARLGEAVRHAAYSIERRNVSMDYTNIAIKGTFVTQGAAELLGDALPGRLRRRPHAAPVPGGGRHRQLCRVQFAHLLPRGAHRPDALPDVCQRRDRAPPRRRAGAPALAAHGLALGRPADAVRRAHEPQLWRRPGLSAVARKIAWRPVEAGQRGPALRTRRRHRHLRLPLP